MSSDPREIAIQVVEVSKAYRVYAEPIDRLKQAVMPRLLHAARPLTRAVGLQPQGREYFRSYHALNPLSFDVRRGETVGIIGQNGSGKSTLLKLICGTLEPSTGQVVTQGRIGALLELGSGFNPEYTGRENVILNASVLGLTREETLERLDDILAFADIGEFIDQPIKTYSSGMAMRLAFSVIAHVSADILVIDEALAVGDIYFQQKCMRWLRQFRENGTVLFCGHDTSAVVNLCQRALWLHEGTLRMEGSGKEVAEAYTAFMHAKAAGLPEEVVRLRGNRAARMAKSAAEPEDAAGAAATPDERQAPQLPEPPRNAPVVFDWMEESTSFGSGAAVIAKAEMTDARGDALTWIEGGEAVRVALLVEVKRDVTSLIAGFHVKDRLGQAITGTNTATMGIEPDLYGEGDVVQAEFNFRLPLLAPGRYSMTVAIADGTLDAHVQLHWIHDAIVFDVHSTCRDGVMVSPDALRVTMTRAGDR